MNCFVSERRPTWRPAALNSRKISSTFPFQPSAIGLSVIDSGSSFRWAVTTPRGLPGAISMLAVMPMPVESAGFIRLARRKILHGFGLREIAAAVAQIETGPVDLYFQVVILAIDFGEVEAQRVAAAGIGDAGGDGGVEIVAIGVGLAAGLLGNLLQREDGAGSLHAGRAAESIVIDRIDRDVGVVECREGFIPRELAHAAELGGRKALSHPENALASGHFAELFGQRLEGKADGFGRSLNARLGLAGRGIQRGGRRSPAGEANGVHGSGHFLSVVGSG